MKRKIALVLVFAIALTLLATGCGGDKKSEEKDLVWYMIGVAPNDLDMVMEEVSKITREKIGVGVKMYSVANADYFKKIQTMLNSGEEFDLCFANQNLLDNLRKGNFYELSDLLKDQGRDMLDAIPEEVFDMARIDGKLYGIPTYKETAWQNTWMINAQIAEKYGIDYDQITTLEEIEPILEKVKQGEGAGFLPLMPWSVGMIGVLPYEFIGDTIFGTKINFDNPGDSDYKIVNVYETEDAKAHFKTMRDYYQKGYLPQDVTANSDANTKGTWFLNLNAYQPEYEISDSAAKGYKIDVIYRHTPVKSNTIGALNAIPVSCTRPEKVMEFLNLVNTDHDIRNMIGYGIKGVHYDLNEQGKRVLTQQGKDNYGSMPQYALGNLMITDLSENDRDGKWDRFEDYNATAIDSPLKGFFFDSTPVKNEIAAMSNVVSQYKQDLLFGRVDPDVVLPEFLKKLKDVGSDKVQAEMQKQFDEFLKNK